MGNKTVIEKTEVLEKYAFPSSQICQKLKEKFLYFLSFVLLLKSPVEYNVYIVVVSYIQKISIHTLNN